METLIPPFGVKRAMRVVIQRVTNASVTVEAKVVSEIQKGLLVFLGIEEADTEEDLQFG